MAKKLPGKVAAVPQRAAAPVVPVSAGGLFTRTQVPPGRDVVGVSGSNKTRSMR